MKVAIIGSGSIAMRYKSIFETHFFVRPVLISDFISRDETCPVIGRGEATNSPLLSDGLDLLIIASENNRHLSDYRLFNSFANKILIEKPLYHRALKNEEIWELESRKSEIFISSPLRFHEGLQELRDRINAVGEVSNIESRCQSWLPDWRPKRQFRLGFWNDPEQGGILREIVHELDYLSFLFGDLEPLFARAMFSTNLSLKVESGIDMILADRWGRTQNVHLDFSSAIPRRYLRIDGTSGSLHWDLLAGTVFVKSKDEGDSTLIFQRDLDRNLTFRRQLSAILELEPWPISATNLQEALSTLRLVDKIYSMLNLRSN